MWEHLGTLGVTHKCWINELVLLLEDVLLLETFGVESERAKLPLLVLRMLSMLPDLVLS